MSAWREYSDCCRISAQDPEARRCGQCGAPLLRCRGFDHCLMILAPHGHCPVHMDPQLLVVAGTRLVARADEELDLNLRLVNPEKARAPLRISKVHKIEGNGEAVAIPISWSSLRPGEARKFPVRAERFGSGGRRLLTLVFEATVEIDGHEESYAFEGGIELDVKGRSDSNVNLNIHASDGARVTAMASGVDQAFAESLECLTEDLSVPLQRADRFELQRRIRGYVEDGLRVLADVELFWRGFPKPEEIPGRNPDQPFLVQDRFRLGRNRIGYVDTKHRLPSNDVCLRVYDPTTGAQDAKGSGEISGTHVELYLQNDRLMLEVTGQHGLIHNGKRVEQGHRFPVRDGDVVAPGSANAAPYLRLRFTFNDDGRVVRRIMIDRF
ncbi:MAG: FHA domain-containing protein [Planctomycetes bacterium]|nr:FHA domain-containing protein [Planctomycetota bacterium]